MDRYAGVDRKHPCGIFVLFSDVKSQILEPEQRQKLIKIVKCYIQTWENEFSKAATERWDSVADVAEQNLNEAKELLAVLEGK